MKKLTAGIFAGILGMVSMGVADANVASTGWVNQQLGTKADTSTVTELSGTVQDLDTAVQGKAAQADLEALDTRVTTAEGSIGTISSKIGTGALPLETTTITAALNAINEKTASDQEVTDLKSSVQTLEGLVGTTSVESQITGALADYYTQDDIDNQMLLKQDASTAVKHTENTPVGSETVPVYIDENGNAIAITSYSGNAATATTATNADHATSADSATNADYATTAGTADTATTAAGYTANGAIATGLAGKVDVPTVDASSSAYGKYVLTADKTAQGTTYYWEQIERAKEGETEIF